MLDADYRLAAVHQLMPNILKVRLYSCLPVWNVDGPNRETLASCGMYSLQRPESQSELIVWTHTRSHQAAEPSEEGS